MKKAIILGASSGIGHEVARLFIAQGWVVGVAARRIDKLTDLQNLAPERVFTAQIDVTDEAAEASLQQLIERMGGLDLYFHAAGIGCQTQVLKPRKSSRQWKQMLLDSQDWLVVPIATLLTMAEDTSLASLLSLEQRDSDLLLLTVQVRLCRTPTYRHWSSLLSLSIITSISQIFVRALSTLPYSLAVLVSLC